MPATIALTGAGAGIARLAGRGLNVTPLNDALPVADVVIFALSDILIGKIAPGVVPRMKPGAIAARQHIVCALMQGPEEEYAQGEQVALLEPVLSGGAKKAVARGKRMLFKDDWKKIFERENVMKEIRAITGTE